MIYHETILRLMPVWRHRLRHSHKAEKLFGTNVRRQLIAIHIFCFFLKLVTF